MAMHTTSRRDWLQHAGASAALTALAALGTAPARAQTSTLQRVRERASLRVAVYSEMPPFHVDGSGIDVDLAHALAGSLGVKAALLPFPADDNMNDDLRNMVWKGHYLGYGPADVLLHVPVDKLLMDANPQVRIVAPYYRERVAIARRLDRLPQLETLAQLAGHALSVPGKSLAGWLLLGADGGAYREQLTTHWTDGVAAAGALQRGEVDAAAGQLSELESVLRDDMRFAITPLPSPRAPRDGWAVGMAVKRDAIDLAQALQAALNELAASGRLGQMFARGNVNWKPV
jgi:ABC-type amino acid transport substrate-binding protein